ncbi:ectoine hydroxylase [Streptomyces sp. NPDC059063]|uniref:ectoine hydroxylase n=1 Tax=unclassified Streptomyces TaxID=2593676 RepID=UPI00369913F7
MTTDLTDRYPTRLPQREASRPRTDPVVWGSAGDGPLAGRDLAAYDRDGFHAWPGLLTPAEVTALTREIATLAADPRLRDDNRTVFEEGSGQVRSVFEVHRVSETFDRLVRDARLLGLARQILGSDVYVHQSRVNYKPGFGGGPFHWHSDFETWHAEDGMPAPRALSVSIALAENLPFNGSLMIIPGSHHTFVPCVGETPRDHYLNSLRTHGFAVGMPDEAAVAELARNPGIEQFTGAAGSAVVFDSNCMHGSNGNITPYPRSNVFIVYNSVHNTLTEPFAAPTPRPTFIAARDFTPLHPSPSGV